MARSNRRVAWLLLSTLPLLLTACGGALTPTTANAGEAASSPRASIPATATTLTLFGAGTLAKPFRTVFDAYQRQTPNVTIQGQFGGSVKMVKQATELGQIADLIAVADYSVIPSLMGPQAQGKAHATWYAGFVGNAITFVYTPHSKGADRINAANWYQILSEPGVQIGRSNPDTDPSGYQTLLALELANQYYHDPELSKKILANAPQTNVRDTETELIGALEAGQIDYLAIYKSDAIQHGFKYLDLPTEINLSDPAQAKLYQQASVTTKNGAQTGKPIIYAITIPNNAGHPTEAARFIQFLLGPEGQRLMAQSGFTVLNPPIASGIDQLPADVRPLVKPWPGS